jgi:hypothetical protein
MLLLACLMQREVYCEKVGESLKCCCEELG